MSLVAFLPLVGTLLDKLFPDPQAAAAAKVQVMEMAQRGELAQLDADTKLTLAQLDINRVEGASSSLFVAGWRPFVGWTCGAAFAYKFVVAPLLTFGFAAVGHPLPLMPELSFADMMPVLLGLLGLAGYRTVEKIKNVA